MSGKKKSLPKLPSMSSEVVKTLTEEPNNRPKVKKETEKKMKTL